MTCNPNPRQPGSDSGRKCRKLNEIVRPKSSKKPLLFLSTLLLISCYKPPSPSGDAWLDWTRQRLDADPQIIMSKKVLWMTSGNGDKVPFLDGNIIASIDGKKIEREFSMSFREEAGKWILDKAGFTDVQPSDEQLNHILADIYGREEFIRAGMLLNASTALDEKTAVSAP